MKLLALSFAICMLASNCNAQSGPITTNTANYPECASAQRDPSLSEGECVARIVLHTTPECKELTGVEYRKCAAKVPSKINPPNPPEKLDLTPKRPDQSEYNQKMAALQKEIDDADRELARINEKIEKRQQCLRGLKIGISEQRALTCGSPDHINGDLRGDDQWVYSGVNNGDTVYVYIDRQHKVADVQWSE